MNVKKGFTLVELLVVIAIIGLLSTLAVVALNQARAKARDARRVSDVKQTQTALELYFADQGTYPIVNGVANAINLGDANHTCLNNSAAGFVTTANCTGTIYMGKVPANFASPATTPATYTYYTDAVGSTYTITFGLEGTVSGLAAAPNNHTATPSGMF